MSILKRWFGKGGASASENPSGTNTSAPAATAPGFDPEQVLQNALAHHNAGRAHEAEQLYRQILAANPQEFNSLHLLGVLYHQRGEHAYAAEKIRAALAVNPDDAPALSNLGECHRALRQYGEARVCYEKAIAHAPDWTAPHFNLGNLHRVEGRLDEALACYKRVTALEPNLIDAHYAMGGIFEQKGALSDAKACYEKVLAAQPAHKLALFYLGNVLLKTGAPGEAERRFRAAVDADKTFVPALVNLGNLLLERGAHAEAHALLTRAAAHDPHSYEAHLALGFAQRGLNNPQAAFASFEAAHKLKPGAVDALLGMGSARIDQGEHQQALAHYTGALRVAPRNARARWFSSIATVPPFCENAAEAEAARAAFGDGLTALEAFFAAGQNRAGHDAVGTLQPFLLAYHEQPNRELLARHGALCARLMGEWQAAHGSRPPAARGGGKVRVGIVSAHISDHSVWMAIIKGFVTHLDRARFHVEIFHLGHTHDHETAFAKSVADHFEPGAKTWQQWAQCVAGRKLDVLIYPEIGMDAATLRLAGMRLAPVQAASWGHPETTGLPTIDYYLSAQLLEPPDAASHYTERLVALPNLGCYMDRANVPDKDPALRTLGVDDSVPLLLCPGVPFKYAPADDAVLVEIARRLKRCQFVFFTHRLANLSAHLRSRLRKAFARAGLDADQFIVFVPWQNRDQFHGMMRRVDVYLDTIGFSGFNTAMQGIECGLPVVTREGRFMRGRLASSLLKRMGVTELIAPANDAYVDLAVKLASDKASRDAVRARIAAARDVLFNDLAPVRALEEFLISAVGKNKGE